MVIAMAKDLYDSKYICDQNFSTALKGAKNDVADIREKIKDGTADQKNLVSIMEEVRAQHIYSSLNLASIMDRMKALDLRLAEAETKATRFRGVHQPAEEYKRGDLVTHQGALWHCNRPTTERPGSGGTDWQLAVKSGGAA